MSEPSCDLLERDAPPVGVRSHVVCVLGMHRSGTSLVTRLLNFAGVFLGPEEGLLPSNDGNAKGYWEQSAFMQINDEILARMGGSWDSPPEFPPGWESLSELDDLRIRTRALIADYFEGRPLWGWKDPRTCLTLPFWAALTGPTRYVICVRNPVDVAASLERRNAFSSLRSADLWLAHVSGALVHTAGRKRMFVFYEDVLRDPGRELHRLASFIGRPDAASDAAVRSAVLGFTDEALRNHASSPVASAEDPASPFPAQAVYALLRSLGGREAHGAEEPETTAVAAALAHRARISLRQMAEPPPQSRKDEHVQQELSRRAGEPGLERLGWIESVTRDQMAAQAKTQDAVRDLQAQLAALNEKIARLLADEEIERQRSEERLERERAAARSARAALERERHEASARVLARDQQLAALVRELLLAHQRYEAAEQQRAHLEERVDGLTGSPLFRVAHALSMARRAVAPEGSVRGSLVRQILRPSRSSAGRSRA
jgi:hypothetical protein